MKDTLTRTFSRYQRSFMEFTTGQKVVAVLGTAALLLAGFLVFRWAATPSYSPLFGNLSSADASAVIDKLDAEGISYKIAGGGSTIMVPKDKVYSTRIALSGAGLPSGSSESGYAILDKQSFSSSQFQEQTSFKRAMEAELSKTIEAINGVQSAVVHLALPEKQVFADEQKPATASVLVGTKPGTTLGAEQVQAVIHLVASSVDGLDPEKVTVADSTGRVLSTGSADGGAVASNRNQQVADYQSEMSQRIQTLLDRVVGPGNSSVAVTANLDFDKAVSEKTTYDHNPNAVPLSQTKQSEVYNGTRPGGVGGVVGPDGQMDSTTETNGADSSYEKKATTQDNAVDKIVERREAAPGDVRSLHVGVVLDAATARTVDPSELQSLIANSIGVDTERGDTVQVSALPFDRTSEATAAKELAAAKKADRSAKQMTLIRNSGLVVLVCLILLLAWLKGRRKAKARVDATNYVVEQLRQEQIERARQQQQQLEVSAAMAALEAGDHAATESMRDELTALVERQPEDVAALLRGWLVES